MKTNTPKKTLQDLLAANKEGWEETFKLVDALCKLPHDDFCNALLHLCK